jgi:hypothetical protein
VSQSAIEAGHAAARLLEDESFTAVLERLRAQYYADFEHSTSSEQRERIHAKLQALGDIPADLKGTIHAGKVAEARG